MLDTEGIHQRIQPVPGTKSTMSDAICPQPAVPEIVPCCGYKGLPNSGWDRIYPEYPVNSRAIVAQGFFSQTGLTEQSA